MNRKKGILIGGAVIIVAAFAYLLYGGLDQNVVYFLTPKELLAKSAPAEWRTPDPQNLVYMDLPQGRVIIELAQDWSPLHAANIRTMIREHYFDGTQIIRVQDNFVTQWGDPDGDDKKKAKSLGTAKETLAPEFTRKGGKPYPFTKLPDGDVYAPDATAVARPS